MTVKKTYLSASEADTQRLAERLAEYLQPGDLIMLSGELGAGKTTFTQGLGRALGVRGPISSPTFIIARVHPSLVSGPALVHVDAYRITGLDDLETLDLDTSLDDSITVVEWGEGKTEGLADNRLEIRINRETDTPLDLSANLTELALDAGGQREIIINTIGPRWESVVLDLQ